MKRALPALLLLALLLPSPAYAGNKGDVAGLIVLGPSLLALFLLPFGLAAQGLILAYAPRRGRGLVHAVERHRVKTVVLGLINTLFLTFFVAATAKPAPLLALIGLMVWLVLILVGSHGLARGVGARILGRDEASGPPSDALEAALGFGTLLFACAIPLLGVFLGTYWVVRATGGAVLSMLAVESAPDPQPAPPPSPPAGG